MCVCVFDAIVVFYLDINLREKKTNNKWENLCGKSNIDWKFLDFLSFIHLLLLLKHAVAVAVFVIMMMRKLLH